MYSTSQTKHPLLPDSLNNKVWIPNLNDEQIRIANEMRIKWKANTLEEIAIKSNFLANSNHPFIFTSVRKSIWNLDNKYDKKAALKQYRLSTSHKKLYKPNE